MIWTKLKKGLALGAAGNTGFCDTFNQIVEILKHLKGEDGVEVRQQGTDWVIRLTGGAASPDDGGGDGSGDGSGDGGDSGSGGTDTPAAPAGIRHVWEDPTIAFGIERMDDGTLKMRGGMLFYFASFGAPDLVITGEGLIVMVVRINPTMAQLGEVSYQFDGSPLGLTPTNDPWRPDKKDEIKIPLYLIERDADGNLCVTKDFVHSLQNVHTFMAQKLFVQKELSFVESLEFAGNSLKQKTRVSNVVLTVKGYENDQGTLKQGSLFTAEDYADGGA